MRFINAGSGARVVLVDSEAGRWERVEAGETVVVEDEAIIAGLAGQDRWEAADGPPDSGSPPEDSHNDDEGE